VTYWDLSVRSSLRPLKHCCQVNPSVLPETTDPDWEFDYVDIGSVSLMEGVTHKERMRFAASPSRARKPVRENDILVSTVRTYLKAIAAIEPADTPQVASTGFAVLRANKGIDARFLYRVVQSNPFVEQVVSQSTGVSYPAINPSKLSNIAVPLPDLATQCQIADFLDGETARIDLLIEKKQRLVDAIKAKISDFADLAVTEGLNAQSPMKSTRLHWIDAVPSHWKIVRGKYLFQQMSRPTREDDEVITAFRDGQVCLRSKRRTEGYTFAELEVGYQHIKKGDLVIHTMDAFAGAIGVSEDDGKSTGEYAVCTPIGDDNPSYFAYLLQCMAKRDYILVLCPSVRERAPRFRFVRFAPVFLPVPPKEEQDAIVDAIERMRSALRTVQTKTITSIDRLKEYRSALITAAVTGQIDVSTYAKSGTPDRRLDAIQEEMGA